MKSKFTWIFTLLLAFFIQLSFAQEKTITGVVTDPSGMPIPGVTVMVENQKPGVQTDFDGKYSITAAVGQKIVFSYVGMATQTVTVGASGTISVQMADDVKMLDDVVVEAYRTTTRATSNVAAATVTSKTIEGRPNASFVQTLQGQIPGLNISSGSGQPGSNNTTVILRGAASINGNIEPLFVIDGVPQNSDNFRSINPNDIESVTVLKDAGATAIYGNRGANGVIIVKTKRGSFESAMSIKYVGSTGFTVLQKDRYDILGSQDLLRLERAKNDRGLGVGMTDAEIAAQPDFSWKDFFFRTGVTQNHTLNIESGSKNLSSFTSVGYTYQDGILKNTDLKRATFRNNLNGKSDNGKFNYSTAMTINYSLTNSATSLGTGGVNQNFVIGALQSLPYITPDDYTSGDDLARNRATLQNTPLFLYDKLLYFKSQSEELRMIGQGQASYAITPELSAGVSLGIDYTGIMGLTSQDGRSFNSIYFRADDNQKFYGFETNSYSRRVSFNTNTNLTYTKRFGEKHTLEASVFTEYFKAHFRSLSHTQNGLDPIFYAPGAGTGWVPYNPDNNYYVPEGSAAKSNAGLFSYFGSVDYDYDQRFGLAGTIRRDASFRFAADYIWGTFWSVAGRWNLDKEAFIGDAFDMLKLRASYGTGGNQDILGTGTFGAANLSRATYDITSGYIGESGTRITQIPRFDLKWETVQQANIGIDFGIWSNRLRGNVDVYQKKTIDLYQGIRVSAVNALSEINANYGSMRNRGVEVALTYDLLRGKDYLLSFNFNGSYNKNELLELPTPNGLVWDGGLTANREGDVLSQYYLTEYAGISPATGNLLFYDQNGNLTENPVNADRKFTGKSFIPKYQGGFGFNAEYKNFFLTTQFNFVADVWRFDYDLANFMDPSDIGTFNKSADLLNYWTPNNRYTDMPSLNASNLSSESFSDRWLRDGSYLRLRYVSLGYNFPKEMLDKTFFSGLRTYVQAENIATWTKWRGLDAESNRANDQSQYPTPKMFSVGLEVQF